MELKPHLVELNFFEDLYNNSISGKLVISESIGFLSKIGINGTEFIKISFSKVNDPSDTIDRTFRIYSITDRVYDVAKLFESYTINFCSEEFVVAQQYRISKSFQNKKISEIISSILNDRKIEFKSEFKFDDCKYKSHLKFDFYIPSKNLCIEFNGIQHYKPIEFFGGESYFKEMKVRDNIKVSFCKSNGINLLIIKYTKDRNKIEDLISSCLVS
jgi:very-short-patch-repair endonuclease